MKKSLLLLAVVALTVSGCKAKPGAGEPGAKLVEERCARCHPMGVKKAHSTQAEWDQTVSNMIARGANVNAAEKALLVDFLTRNYRP